jgi:hypothetical protein
MAERPMVSAMRKREIGVAKGLAIKYHLRRRDDPKNQAGADSTLARRRP